MQFTRVFALQLEFMYAQEAGEISSNEHYDFWTGDIVKGSKDTFSYGALSVPLLAKLTFRPGNFLIAPFGGFYVGTPLGEPTYAMVSSFAGFLIGADIGVKLGPGVLFVDIRYAGNGDGGKLPITLGYEFGPIKKKAK